MDRSHRAPGAALKPAGPWLRAVLLGVLVALTLVDGASADPPRRARHHRVQGRRHGRAPRISPAYRRMRAHWHRSATRAEVRAWKRQTPPPMVLRPVNRGGEYIVVPGAVASVWSAESLITMRQALAYKGAGEEHEIHPRLLELVYRAVRKFNAPYVYVISGYRPARAASRHGQGRAMDFVLPGVSDRRLADFLRRQGYVGVGIYPQSGFVHLDVRAASYFWIDPSAPGGSQRTRPILRDLARAEDRRAARRNEVPVPDAILPEEGENESDSDGGPGQ